MLAARGHRVLGIDASPTLARAVRTHPQPQPVVIADAIRLPLADGAADLAVAHMSLQDVDDLEGAVAEIARVLRPRGRLCAAVVARRDRRQGGAVDDLPQSAPHR